MKKLSFYGVFLSLVILCALPQSSHAYGTSEQTAVRLTPSHVLFTITYDFGFLNRGTYAPLMANTGSIENEVSYEIRDSSDNVKDVTSAGFVTATHSVIENNFHRLEYGKKSDFTLFVIAEIPQTSTGHYLQITNLPFILIDKDKSTTLSGAEASRLPEYKTPTVR
jgi:hypothetical protein